MVRDGRPQVWFDHRSSHLVTFADTAEPGWAEALRDVVGQRRARSVEVRKVNGEPLQPGSDIAAALAAAGFVEGYRGWVYRP